jgi:hypothetical protein
MENKNSLYWGFIKTNAKKEAYLMQMRCIPVRYQNTSFWQKSKTPKVDTE